jgi:hypothetical protein
MDKVELRKNEASTVRAISAIPLHAKSRGNLDVVLSNAEAKETKTWILFEN